LLAARRNDFFYVLDRTDGKLLLGKPFVDKLTWAKGLDEDGRPILNPNSEPTEEGNLVCPSVQGATNWFSTAYSPNTGLYYVQTTERCSVFIKQ
jgi:alcohol dehydrogenase (cytochrome c)